jgi:hypothetical protein
MADDWDTFLVGLQDDGRSVERTVLDATQALAFEAVRGVVLLTPIVSGRLRGNWQVTTNAPAEGFDDSKRDESGQPTIAAGEAVIERAKPYEPIWLHNGVPYATYVETGTERMQPRAMVARTIERLRGMRL